MRVATFLKKMGGDSGLDSASTDGERLMNPQALLSSQGRTKLQKLSGLFVYSVVGVLLFASLAKFVSTFGSASILELDDVIIPLQNRQLLQFTAILESVVVWFLIVGQNQYRKLAVIAWLSILFAVYRVGSYLLSGIPQCPCLGTITELLPVSPEAISRIFSLLVSYMLIGSLCLIFGLWLENRINERRT